MAKHQVDDGELPFEAENGGYKMPTLDEMLKALDGLQGLSDEDKEELRRSLMERSEIGGDSLLKEQIKHTGSGPNVEMLTLFAFLSVIIIIFVFFGYKLYKSLVEKERRRDEKRKQKQQKKKK